LEGINLLTNQQFIRHFRRLESPYTDLVLDESLRDRKSNISCPDEVEKELLEPDLESGGGECCIQPLAEVPERPHHDIEPVGSRSHERVLGVQGESRRCEVQLGRSYFGFALDLALEQVFECGSVGDLMKGCIARMVPLPCENASPES